MDTHDADARSSVNQLLNTAEIGILYVDNEMHIRRLSSLMAKVLQIPVESTGKSLRELTGSREYPEVLTQIEEVLKSRQAAELEVLRDERIWLLRLRPAYLLKDEAGVMAILFDITQRLEAAKYELELLMSSIPGGVCKFEYNNGLILRYGNAGLFGLIKMTPEEFKQTFDNHYDRLLSAGDWKHFQEEVEKCSRNNEMLQIEYAVHYGKNREEWRMMQAVILKEEEHPVLQCVVTDITQLKQTERMLMQEQQKLRTIAELSGDMLFEYDIKHDTMEYTKSGEGLLNADQITRHYVETVLKMNVVKKEDEATLRRFCEELKEGKPHICAELRRSGQDGQYHWIEIEGKTICDFKGKPVKVIGRFNNIDERKKKEEQYLLYKERDSLTGLYNCDMILDRIKERMRNMEQGESAWMLIVDVDNFKRINDRNGHLVGDAVLCMVADELKHIFDENMIGRIGGDEFLVWTENISKEELEENLQTLQSTVAGIYKDANKGKSVSCSIGVAKCQGKGLELGRSFRWADYALYQVKQGNKNGFWIEEDTKKADAPATGHLERETEDVVREETAIHNADELVVFSLELLSSIPDAKSGLRMVSDRVCSFFDIDDIAFISEEDGVTKKEYHWSRSRKEQLEQDVLKEAENWDHIWDRFNNKGFLVLHHDDIARLSKEQLGSVLLVYTGKARERHGCIVFVCRNEDRYWESNMEPLGRLADILSNHLRQMKDAERERNELEFRINYDSLTGLPQYHKFIHMVNQYREEEKDQSYYVAYADFANFQYINGTYGFEEGDQILQLFAKHMQRLEGGICFCRVNSDHFVGFLEGKDESSVQNQLYTALEQFCDQVKQTYGMGNLVLISGLSSVGDDEETVSAAIDRANVARKYGKSTATTAVFLYNQDIKSRSDMEKMIVASMDTALIGGEFKAWLQPKVSLKTGKIVGAEALVRWQKPDGSMVYPDQFIPLFEKNGFITNVDFAVLEQVLDYLHAAIELGEEIVPISVNFSRRHNEKQNFVDEITRRIEERGIPSAYLEAEITESMFMRDMSALTSNIHRLKERGIAISIDDFGSGYSSLNMLANMEVDIIKLDKEFLKDTEESSKSLVFIKYLIKMMKHMGYKVIAEGVETEEQLTFLHNAECDMVQGYYYARPMPIPDFRAFLKEFNGRA